MKNRFDKIDKNGNGLLSKREFRRATKAANNAKDDPENLTNKQINEAFEYLDQNNDNKLDFNEFKRVTEIIQKRIAPNLILWGIRLLLFSANAY